MRGLDDVNFEQLVTKEELWKVIKDKPMSIPEEEYDTLFEITRQNMGGNTNIVTYKAFLETIRNLKRDYLKYRTMFKKV